MHSAGIPLVDLFDLTDRINSALPGNVQNFIDQLAVTHHQVSRSDAAVFHFGELRAISDSLTAIPTEFNIGIGKLSVPLLQTGIPFQLAFARLTGTGNLEPLIDSWRLDLSLDAFTLITEKLEPAIFVPETGTTPRHLVRDGNRENVRITGSAVLRIERRSAGASVTYRFIDQPDPLDPLASSGAVVQVIASPPHFFIGGSEFGLSIGKLIFDASDSFSPPDVIERNQGPGWQGVLIREATFYAPRNLPGVGDLSGGIKNVLLGSPTGLQGELEIQFGRTALDPAAFQFEQVTATGRQALGISGSGTSRIVTLEAAQTSEVLIHGGFVTPAPPDDGSIPADGLQDWKAVWIWDEVPQAGQSNPSFRLEEGDSASGTVRHGMELSVTPIEVITVDGEEEEFEHPDITFRFVAAGTAPRIDVTVGTEQFTNVVHLGGTAAELRTVQLAAVTATTGSTTFEWQVGNLPAKHRGSMLDLATIGDLPRSGFIVVRETVGDDDERISRLQWQTLDAGDLLVGCESGVFNAADDSTALALSAAEYTVDLSDFHTSGDFEIRLEQATLDPADSRQVIVPADGLVQVAINPGAPAVLERDRHVQILMDFDTTDINRWGEDKPVGAPGAGAFSQSDLLAWANRYPGADFIIVGRCGDLGSVSINTTLAKERAARGRELLSLLESGQRGTAIAGSRVFVRGEQAAFSGDDAAGDSHEEDVEIQLTAAEKSEASTNPLLNNGWLILSEQDTSAWPTQRGDDLSHPAESIRETYRRIDIYAVGGSPTAETARVTDEPILGADLRRSLVPASGRDAAPIPAGSPAIDYRVRLRVVWDSPTVSELKDAIPTLAEAEFAWTPQQAPLPMVGGAEVELSREVLTVFANWTHDARTGYTKATLGIKSEGDPDGLIAMTNKTLTAALAFGPALLSGVDSDSDVIESGARIAALLAAVSIAEQDLGGGDTFIATGSKAVLLSAALETEMRSISDPGPDMQLRVLTDYVCTLHINAGVFGIRTVEGSPVKIRYKNVGIEYDTSAEGWERFALVYDSTALEIEDPGRWQIDGVLGQFLRIVEVAMGRGSIWFEARIAIALEIGVIEITEAIIRLTFHDGSPIPAFELRGFVLKANIPGVLEGEGRLRIEDGGVIRAGVDASIVPLQLAAQAGIAVGKPPEIDPSVFLELYLGVQFATPLPLAQSGLAIYGFKGLFVMNGTRKLSANPDPVGRELDWWRAPPGTKYEPRKDQYALGVGVVVGTMPDVSFCVSCGGMVVVAFPDPEVILGVDVNIIEVPDTTVTDEGGASGTITGLIVIDDEAVKLAVSAQYTIPQILEVHVPFSGYFPYPGSGKNVYVRIGSDGQTAHGRFGEPVTLKLLPGTLDVRAWTYLMIEQGGLPSLGGDSRFSFDGFSVGWGAGWDINWRAGPIKLSASAKVLVGLGTAPLIIKGGVFVAGELDLVVVSVSARGELILEMRKNTAPSPENLVRVSGEFCGEVDLFFFSLSGCVGVSFGNELDLSAPTPPSPVKSISLTDRRDRIMGKGTGGIPAGVPVFSAEDPAAAAAVDDNHTVWPDTAPIIHFSHYVDDAMSAGAQFKPLGTVNPPKWWGSNGLKYAYRIDSIELRRSNGALVTGDAPLQSVWTTTPYRQPDSSGQTAIPSEHEGPNLKLLDWNPWAWVVNMDDGGASQDGDPVDTVDDICQPKPVPRVACVLGRDARRKGINRIRLRQQTPSAPPYPSRFYVTGEPVLRLIPGQRLVGRAVQTTVEDAGGHLVAGGNTALPFAADVHGGSVTQGYRLPAARLSTAGQIHFQTMPWEGLFDRQVARPVVLLMVCATGDPGTGDGGGGPGDKACEDFRDVSPGEQLDQFEHQGIGFKSLSRTQQLRLTDMVDQRSSPAIPGNDGSAEIAFPNEGVEIRLPRPCDRVEVHVMLFAGPLKGEAFAANGQRLDGDSTTTTQKIPLVMTFNGNASTGVSRIMIAGGSAEAAIFRICCRSAESPRRCIDFRDLQLDRDKVSKFNHAGMAFSSRAGLADLSLTDLVNTRPEPDQPGRDRLAELLFGDTGVRIQLKESCEAVQITVMLFAGKAVGAVASNSAGRRISKDTTTTDERVPQVLTLKGPDVHTIELSGGASEAVIIEICCQSRNTGPTRPLNPPRPVIGGPVVVGPVIDGPAIGAPRRPVFPDVNLFDGANAVRLDALAAVAPRGLQVRGIIDDTPFDGWPGKIIQQGGDERQGCQLMAFSPSSEDNSPWRGFQIDPPAGVQVTLVAVCGVDQAIIDARDEDMQAQAALRDTLNQAIALDLDERREIVLQPGETYDIDIVWSWQSFQPDDPDETPPDPDPAGWISGAADHLSFKVASDATVANTPQDGLNEFVFDARDVSRYLIAVEPADGRSWQFTDDPIWIHFDNGHVEQLLSLYGRALEIEVRRTDPPPQPTPELLTAVLAPLTVAMTWQALPGELQPTGYQRLNEAILRAPCLGEGSPMGGASVAALVDLEPDADYDLRVLAPRTGDTDPAVVLATRFHTSRYGNPRALLDALGYPVGMDGPFLPGDLLIPEGMTLPTGAFAVSDAELDAALAAVDADTWPLPTRRSATQVLWRFAGTHWQIEGVLIDSLEPLKRVRTVVEAGSSVPTVGTRCDISHVMAGSHRLALYRSNANWTRVLLTPVAPIVLSTGIDHVLSLHLETSDGVISGGRRVRAVPSIIEREGL